MLVYRTPGVYFEWLDTPPPVIGPRRTDIAGFVGIAARGPLHTPMKVESWTQFVSTFGGHIPQGYLTYAVEGFFANGGQTCWVVRAANPDQACPAWLDLLDDNGNAALRLIAFSPGIWGEGITVSIIQGQGVVASKTLSGEDRFSLVLRLSDGGQELWRNLSMNENDERYVEKVLNDSRTGSRLVRVCTEGLLIGFTKNTPSARILNLRGVTLVDETGQPTLDLTAPPPDGWGQDVTLSVMHSREGRFSLVLQSTDGRQEVWRELNMHPSDPRYVESVLNDSKGGSWLMKAQDRRSKAWSPKNRPMQGTLKLHAGSNRLAYGRDGLAPSLNLEDSTGQPTLRLTASGPGNYGQNVTVSVAHSGADRFSLTLRAPGVKSEEWQDLTMSSALLDLLDSTDRPTLRIVTSGPSNYGQNVTVSVAHSGADRFSLTLRAPGVKSEEWQDLTMLQSDPRYAETLLNDPLEGSRLVTVRDLKSPAGFPANTPDPRGTNLRTGIGRPQPEPHYVETVINNPQTGSSLVTVRDLRSPARFPKNTPDPQAPNLSNGTGKLGGGLNPYHLSGEGTPPDKPWGLAALEAIDEVSVVAIPDIMPKPRVSPQTKTRQPRCDVLDGEPFPPPVPETRAEFPPFFDGAQILTLQLALIGHCEKLKDRVAVLDARLDDSTPPQVIDWRDLLSDQKYAALYYPWLMVPDPLHLEGLLRAVPPSGHVAGVYARGDLRVGVHKPPANEVVEGANDVLVLADDVTHGALNEQGVNVIRPYNGRNVRIAGARTLSRDSLWRFVNVRRLLIMIEEAIDEGTQWTVFEPNNRDLWRQIDRVARSFLDGLWRSGMLDGATAEEAYVVRCDETTNTPEETEAGRLICLIGVLPPWPAEFVIVRIGKTEGSTAILEGTERQNG